MAKVNFMNGLLTIHGKIGDTIYRTTRSGETIAYQQQFRRHSPPTEKELMQRKRFSMAVQITSKLLYNMEIQKVFEKQFKSISPKKRPHTLRGYVMKQVIEMIKEIEL